MATHSNILAWEIPWREKPGYSPWSHKESDMTDNNCIYVNPKTPSLCLLLLINFSNHKFVFEICESGKKKDNQYLTYYI